MTIIELPPRGRHSRVSGFDVDLNSVRQLKLVGAIAAVRDGVRQPAGDQEDTNFADHTANCGFPRTDPPIRPQQVSELGLRNRAVSLQDQHRQNKATLAPEQQTSIHDPIGSGHTHPTREPNNPGHAFGGPPVA